MAEITSPTVHTGPLIATTGAFSGAVSMTALTATTGAFSGAVTLSSTLAMGTGMFTMGGTTVTGAGLRWYVAGGAVLVTGDNSALGSLSMGALTTNGGLQTFGANDSAGAGFRTVRVPNV